MLLRQRPLFLVSTDPPRFVARTERSSRGIGRFVAWALRGHAASV